MFEPITEKEFKGSGVTTLEAVEVTNDGNLAIYGTPDNKGVGQYPSLTHPLIYCEFCKGYYNEYHVERWDDNESGR